MLKGRAEDDGKQGLLGRASSVDVDSHIKEDFYVLAHIQSTYKLFCSLAYECGIGKPDYGLWPLLPNYRHWRYILGSGSDLRNTLQSLTWHVTKKSSAPTAAATTSGKPDTVPVGNGVTVVAIPTVQRKALCWLIATRPTSPEWKGGLLRWRLTAVEFGTLPVCLALARPRWSAP